MSTAVLSKHSVAHEAGHDHDHEHHDAGGMTVFGFWLYLMTDCILFASVFATYAVLVGHTAGGPSGKDIFELPYVAVETAILLISSCTYGLAMLAAHKGAKAKAIAWLGVTFLCGAAFIAMEVNEFHHLIEEGAGPHRSAFLSSFFALVGTHGLHVTFGIIWLVTLMVQVAKHGLIAANKRRLMCLSMFWHFLDVIWIGVFSFVYLMGVL